MASLIVLPTKRRSDVQVYTFDFSSIIPSGDSIASAEVLVQVFTGVDEDPEHILARAFSVDGNKVIQPVQLGISGVVYEFVVTVITAATYTYVIEARLAILPEGPSAGPNYVPFFLSSRPYPAYFLDEADISGVPIAGRLKTIIIECPFVEELNIGGVPLRGSLRLPILDYEYLEELDISAAPISGSLRIAILSYEFLEELDISGLPTGGILRDALVSTEYLEELDISGAPIGGSLYVP